MKENQIIDKVSLEKIINIAIPSVYDDSLSYLEVLQKLIVKMNELVPAMNGITDNIDIICEEVLNQFLIDGELGVDASYNESDESLSLVFSKVAITKSVAGKVVYK